MTANLPPLWSVRRRLPAGEPVDIARTLDEQWHSLGLSQQVRGKRIAIGIGSRGIAGVAEIARHLVAHVVESGGEPFIVPAMGSHGGATPAGQIAILESLGITEAPIGCPIRATMQTVILGQTQRGLPVHMDRFVAESDGLLIVNRVKIHTDFHAPHESGLLKMLTIGLGKEAGASLLHSFGVPGIRDDMPQMAAVILECLNIIAGIATIEDGYHRPVELEILPPDAIIAAERRLLERSRELTPRLPVDDVDVLVVEVMGKEVSGTGMDTNVIGRLRIAGEAEPETPNIKAVVVLDLTEASHGNALGVGLADFTTRRLLDKIDFAQTTKNVFTSGFLERGRLPLVCKTDADAIQAAIDHVFRANPQGRDTVRMMRIRSTLDLEEIQVTPNLLDDVKSDPGFISATEPRP